MLTYTCFDIAVGRSDPECDPERSKAESHQTSSQWYTSLFVRFL